MRECLVNDTPLTADFRPETWGELLERLDGTLGAERRVVTAVRFDGVDEPSFRAPAQAGRPLAAVTRVDVEAPSAAQLVEEAVAAAADSLAALADGARSCAAAYRAQADDAHGQLAALIGAVQSLVTLTTAAATAAQAARGGRGGSIAAVDDACRAAEHALTALIDRHTRADWPGLADGLDGDLARAILDWRDVLAAVRAEVA